MVRETKEGLYLDTDDSPFWYVTVYPDGKRRRISTKERDHARAIKSAHKIRQEILRKAQRKTLKQPFVENIDEWIEVRSKTWHPGTTHDVKTKLKIAKLHFDGCSIDDIDEHAWEGFLGFMAEKHPKRRIGKIQDYLSSFLKYQFHRGYISRVPELRDPDKASTVGRALHADEIESILSACSLPKYQKLLLQVLMQLRMGMRSGEALKLSKDAVDLRASMIRLEAEDTKTRTARSIPIHDEVMPMLRAQMESNDSAWVFPNPSNMKVSISAQGNKSSWSSLLKRAGVRCRRHDLRHTCATQFARDRIAPMIACRILGMSLAVYDKVYCKPSEDDLKAAFEPSKNVKT